MQLTKYTHACVRLTAGDRTLVIDPGVWSESSSLTGATDVLITHEHIDHLDIDQLTAALAADPRLRVYTHAAVAQQLGKLGDAVITVDAGESFTAAGFAVRAVGGMHAEIYDGLPGCANLGFLITADESGGSVVYHPGDSLFLPEVEVHTLLVPAGAPWLKTAEAIDFVRAIAPSRAHPIHDGLLNANGLAIADRWFNLRGDTDYSRIEIGESVTIDG